MTEISLCCAPACPIYTGCMRHENHYDNARAWMNYGSGIRLTAVGTFECDSYMPFRPFATQENDVE